MKKNPNKMASCGSFRGLNVAGAFWALKPLQESLPAQLSIINNENTPHEKQLLFNVPMRKTGDLTLVGSFVYP
ncbi:hypothetical protein [Iodobacter fluviatilis]|nr:hypothetical protein [Iodobacter fluviatilis]